MGSTSRHVYLFVTTVFLLLQLVVSETYYLQQGEVVNYDPRQISRDKRNPLQIYCYEGKPKYVIHIWQTVFLEIDSKLDNYVYYEGLTPQEIQKDYSEHHTSWSLNLFSWKQKRFRLDPFNQSCIGIDSNELYRVYLHVVRIDYWKIVCLLTGLTLFFSAKKLSDNTLFYYICGISLGICTSFLILIYFISKLFPRKPMMYGVAAFGWTVGVYILQMLWENVRTILLNYQSYVAWYAVVTGLISFIICYRWGPVTNQRTKNLIQWTLQSSGLIAVFCSSEFREAAMGQALIVLLVHNFPRTWVLRSKTYWKKKFPPKVKLLSNDDYYQQGVQETSKALEDLRKYCSSPDCNQWKTALNLKDVKRFALFMEGNSHLSDDEILDYESSIQCTELTDDESDDSLTQ